MSDDKKNDATEDLFLSRKYRIDKGIEAGKAVSENMVGYSLFDKLAIGVPIGYGTYIGVTNIFKNSTDLTFSNRRKSSTRSGFIKNFINTSVDNTGIVSRTKDLLHNPGVSDSMIRHAWDVTVKTVDPEGTASGAILGSSDISQSIIDYGKNTTVKSNSVLNSFHKQLSILQADQAFTGFATLKANKPKSSLVKINSLPDSEFASSLHSIIDKLEESGVNVTTLARSRPGIEGTQLTLLMRGGIFGKRNATFDVPIELKGAAGQIVTGQGLQTKRIVGQYGLVNEAGKVERTLPFHKYALRRFENEIVPKIVSGEIGSSNEIRKFQLGLLDDTQYVPNVPRGMSSGQDMANDFLSNRVRLVHNTTLLPLLVKDTANVIADPASGLYPSTSPKQ